MSNELRQGAMPPWMAEVLHAQQAEDNRNSRYREAVRTRPTLDAAAFVYLDQAGGFVAEQVGAASEFIGEYQRAIERAASAGSPVAHDVRSGLKLTGVEVGRAMAHAYVARGELAAWMITNVRSAVDQVDVPDVPKSMAKQRMRDTQDRLLAWMTSVRLDPLRLPLNRSGLPCEIMKKATVDLGLTQDQYRHALKDLKKQGRVKRCSNGPMPWAKLAQ